MTVRQSTVLQKNADGYEQIVYAEVLIPDVVNTWGDIYTRDAIREFAYEFMIAGLNTKIINDIEHDRVDITGKMYVIESFVARDGDTQFIPGSWVIGVKINDADIWAKIMNHELNGFSFEAMVGAIPVYVENLRSRIITGITAPDPIDGHTHTFAVIVDARNRPISGATGDTDGHSHQITDHTITDAAAGHKHRFDVLNQNGENSNV